MKPALRPSSHLWWAVGLAWAYRPTFIDLTPMAMCAALEIWNIRSNATLNLKAVWLKLPLGGGVVSWESDVMIFCRFCLSFHFARLFFKVTMKKMGSASCKLSFFFNLAMLIWLTERVYSPSKLIFVCCIFYYYFLVQVEQVWLLPFLVVGDCGAWH